MTRERALEILTLGNNSFGEYRKHMTPDEIWHIQQIWDRAPGNWSFYSCICAVAHRPEWAKDVLL